MQTLRTQIAQLIRMALQEAQVVGDLAAFELPDVVVSPSRHASHGDYGTPVCLGLARVLRRAPIQIAQAVVPHIPAAEYIAEVTVAPPGYINFTLDAAWLGQQVPAILDAGEDWGRLDIGAGQRVQVEFVSANPTGPLHIGSARNAVIGDTLAAVFAAAGYTVEREYYVNDAGSKVRKFGTSIFARYAELLGADFTAPEDIYPGAYVIEMARQVVASEGRRYLDMDLADAVRELGRWGIDAVLQQVREDMAHLRIHFDTWFRESTLYQSGLFDQMMDTLRAGGYILEYDGATWFTHPDLEKDAVLIRSPRIIPNPAERPTYLASDIPYLWNKVQVRKFDKAIYIWGADHHGDVPRVQAAAQAVGVDPDRLVFIIYQMVNLMRSGEEVRMSKSSGEFVTLRELVDEVGPDPIRFMMLTRTVDVTLDFDLDLVVEQSDRNPVYYVQYAHTRIAGVLRKAGAAGLDPHVMGNPALLTHPSELALIRKMLALPEIIAIAAHNMAPHHLTLYATELASMFSAFYRDCRVVAPESLALSNARLMLARATKAVLARVLHLMGMDAPEQM